MASAPAAAALKFFSRKVHSPRRTTAIPPSAMSAAFRIGSAGVVSVALQARPIHTMSPLTGPTSANFGWSPASSMAGYVFPASGPAVTSRLSASTVPSFPVWLPSKSSPVEVLTAVPGSGAVGVPVPNVRLPGGWTVTQASKSSSPSTTMVPSSLGHTEWLLTSPSNDPFTGSSACDTTSGLAGSLMSSKTNPESQAAAYIRFPSSVTVMSCTERIRDPPKPGVGPVARPAIHQLIVLTSTVWFVSLYGSELQNASTQRSSGPHALTNCGLLGTVMSKICELPNQALPWVARAT